MTSWSFSELSYLFFFRPHDPKSEKKIPVNQLIKKFWPYSFTDLVDRSYDKPWQTHSKKPKSRDTEKMEGTKAGV